MPEPSGRLRLNWVCPVPPEPTAIAHYALGAMPALSHHADIVVWTNQSEWTSKIEPYAHVRRWRDGAWPELHAADATIVHIGNDVRYHGWMLDITRQYPAIVVLHDYRLHDLFLGHMTRQPGGDVAYVDAVRRHHGDGAAREAQRVLRGETTAAAIASSAPMTAMALERARGAIVHTGGAYAEVVALGCCPVLQLELPYDAPSPPPSRVWQGVLRLVVFGYLGGNRRLEQLLRAIALFPERQRLQLDILGQVHDPDAVSAMIRELGIADVVRLRGYVPEEELDESLDAAHLAINLRYPTMGEASASQLRIWSRALPSLVTRTGWYAELPPGTVAFVDHWDEVWDLHAHFRRALADPGTLEAMGHVGRRHLETRHHPERYAAGLVDGVRRMIARPTSIHAHVTTSVARVLASARFDAGAATAIARRAAEELARWTG